MNFENPQFSEILQKFSHRAKTEGLVFRRAEVDECFRRNGLAMPTMIGEGDGALIQSAKI